MGFQFRGQRIVNATFHTLQQQHGLGSLPHTKVVFGGCSAGSRGAMFNLDVVANAVVPKGTQVLGFLDSPLWVDELPFDSDSINSNVMPLMNETQLILPLINPTLVLDPDCVEAYPGPDTWKCLFGQYRLPFVKTPFLVSASQFDKYQLSYNENSNPPWSGDSLTYANAFQSTVRQVLAGIPTVQQPYSAVFSTACFKHCTSDIGDFWGVKIGRISLKTWLEAWLQDSLPQARLVENCLGFGCGQCHAKPGANATTLADLYSPPPPSPPPPSPPRSIFGRHKTAPAAAAAAAHATAVGASAGAAVVSPTSVAAAPSPRSALRQVGRNVAIAAVLIAALAVCLSYATRVVRRPPTLADDMERRRLLGERRTAGGYQPPRTGKWGIREEL